MPITKILRQKEKFEIQKYKKPRNLELLRETHVAFSGSPQKHPHDSEKILIIVDPFCANTFFYEFKTDDISFVEELPNQINPDGEVIPMARVWLKKLSVGIRCTPFKVVDF